MERDALFSIVRVQSFVFVSPVCARHDRSVNYKSWWDDGESGTVDVGYLRYMASCLRPRNSSQEMSVDSSQRRPLKVP